MYPDKKEVQKELDKIEDQFDKNYKERERLEAEQVKLIKKLEVDK